MKKILRFITVSALSVGISWLVPIKGIAADVNLQLSSYWTEQGKAIVTDAQGNMILIGNAQYDPVKYPSATRIGPASGSTSIVVAKLSRDGSRLLWITFIGGGNYDYVQQPSHPKVLPDQSICLVGSSRSTDFPTTSNAVQRTLKGFADGVIVRLSSDGRSLLYSTYFGGNGLDRLYSVNFDADQNIFITGDTDEDDQNSLPSPVNLSHGGAWEGFLAKINSAGSAVVFTRYIGGSYPYRDIFGQEVFQVQLDPAGNAIVAAGMESDDAETTPDAMDRTLGGRVDGFIAKVDPAGRLLYASYLGGSDWDATVGLQLDSQGNIYLTGNTESSDFPVVNADQPQLAGSADGFIMKLSPNFVPIFSTYFGGTNGEYPQGISVLANGNVAVVGYTDSPDFPVTPDAIRKVKLRNNYDAFFRLYDPNGRLLYSTFMGEDNSNDQATAVSIDAWQDVVITGNALAAGFPTTPGAYIENYNNSNGFFMKFMDKAVSFDQENYNVQENVSGGKVVIRVNRLGTSLSGMKVNFRTQDGSAKAGSDYGATSGTLEWPDGDISAKTIEIPIIDDNIAEPDESFTLSLVDPTIGARLGSYPTTTITIHDNDLPPPTLASILPNTGPTSGGTPIIINGGSFVAGATVQLGGANATSVVFVNASQLTAVTPAGTAGAKDVVVTNPDGQIVTLTIGFAYVAPPGSFTINPSSGPTSGGTSITISGSNFISGATVKVGGVNAASVVFVNASQLTAVTPSGTAGARSVVVINPDGQTSTLTNGFTYIPPPGPFTVSPNSGPTSGGTSITITGSNFFPGAMVKVGGVNAASVIFVNSTQLTAVTPAGTAGAKDVTVTNPDGHTGTLTNGFTYLRQSGIQSIIPNSGPTAGGTFVIVTGSGFDPGLILKIGGTNATAVSIVNVSQVSALTPPGIAGSQDVVLINPNGQSVTVTNGFTYIARPGLFTITPNSGPIAGGTGITLNGGSFRSGATVKIDGRDAASIAFVSDTQLTAVTPAGTVGAKDVVVTNPDGQSVTLANGFSYFTPPAPGPFTISPNSGPTSGGTTITLFGSHLVSGSSIKIGGTDCLSVVLINSTQMTAVTPAGTVGTKDVLVINPDGQSASLAAGFTYADLSPQTSILRGVNIFDPKKGQKGEISYRLNQSGHVTIVVYDRFGIEVLTLVDETRGADSYVDRWDGRNSEGALVASGFYNVILSAGGVTTKLKLVVMK